MHSNQSLVFLSINSNLFFHHFPILSNSLQSGSVGLGWRELERIGIHLMLAYPFQSLVWYLHQSIRIFPFHHFPILSNSLQPFSYLLFQGECWIGMERCGEKIAKNHTFSIGLPLWIFFKNSQKTRIFNRVTPIDFLQK